MITHISLIEIWVNDHDASKAFYIDKLGFVETADVTMGDGYRWVTIAHPDHRDLEVTLMKPGPPLDDDDAKSIKRLMDKGSLPAVGLHTNDCQAAFEQLSEAGVEFTQEPSDRPYGVEAVFRDNTGNWIVLVERNTQNQ